VRDCPFATVPTQPSSPPLCNPEALVEQPGNDLDFCSVLQHQEI
jgi:hypothetical protein